MSKKIQNQFACSGLMLPEHRAQLTARHRKKRKDAFLPSLLDEQQHEIFQSLLERSLRCGLEIHITVLTAQGEAEITGVVQKTDPLTGRIYLSAGNTILTIQAGKVVKIRA